jgi:hypothetical protein
VAEGELRQGELRLVLQQLHITQLREGPDLRSIASPAASRFSSREAYRLLSPIHPRDVSACRSWALRLPAKLRIFAYLTDIDRLSTRANLFYKSCAACLEVETRRHLFFNCYLARETWTCLLVRIPLGSFSILELPALSPFLSRFGTPVWLPSCGAFGRPGTIWYLMPNLLHRPWCSGGCVTTSPFGDGCTG